MCLPFSSPDARSFVRVRQHFRCRSFCFKMQYTKKKTMFDADGKAFDSFIFMFVRWLWPVHAQLKSNKMLKCVCKICVKRVHNALAYYYLFTLLICGLKSTPKRWCFFFFCCCSICAHWTEHMNTRKLHWKNRHPNTHRPGTKIWLE